MIARLLGIRDALSINYFAWHFRRAWPHWIAAALVLAAFVYVFLLYRRELGLSNPRRLLLGSIRGTLLALLVFMFFQPVFSIDYTRSLRSNVLVLVDRSDSMAIRDQRQRPSEWRDAALALGKIKFEDSQVPDALQKDMSDVARADLARGILHQPQAPIIDQLSQAHTVRMFEFASQLEQMAGDASAGALAAQKPAATDDSTKVTALGSAIDQAVNSYGGQPIAGVVVISDGGSNSGADPLEIARQLGKRNIAVFPVGVGLPDPPDVAVADVIVQDTVFIEDRAPVRVQLRSNGFDHQRAELRLTVDGREVDKKTVTLVDGFMTEDLSFIPGGKKGTVELQAAITPLPGETFVDNNTMARSVNVTDEKIRVLYIEGKPRWEFRYLRAVLQRDRRLAVKYLMTRGDPDLAKYDPEQYIDRFPEDAATAFKWDLVIIGDVPASYFRPGQLDRIAELVRDRGGSLLMIAGRRYAPATYAGSALADALPIKVDAAGTVPLDNDVCPVTTADGMAGPAALEPLQSAADAQWSVVRPMYSVPLISGAKKGATVLLTLPHVIVGQKEPYPLVCWQRYGTGKCMYVGSDQLWRLRFKQGDQYHARFWGQSIQFLTLSRLLGANKRITISTDRKAYQTGDRVQVFANVLSTSYEPVRTEQYTVTLSHQGGDHETTPLRLDPVPDAPGMFQGYFTAAKEGQWSIAATGDDAPAANTATLDVRTVAMEQRDPAMQEQTLRKMAELSGGKFITMSDLPGLAKLIRTEPSTVDVRLEKELWDLPGVFIALVVLAGVEWYVRRRSNLL